MIKNVYEFLKNSADKYPDKIVVVNGFYENIEKSLGGGCKEYYTYKELDYKVKSLATSIIKTSLKIDSYNTNKNNKKELDVVESDTISQLSPIQKSVFILLPKSAECLASFYAVALSGEFYTLQDIATPKERLKNVITKLESKILITSRKIANDFGDLLSELKLEIIFIDDAHEIEENLLSLATNRQIDTDLLYVLFTSGSTGEPKGVCIRHKSVVDYIEAILDEYKITSDEIFASQLPFYFDASLKDLFPTIAMGATLHIIPNNIYAFVPKVMKYLEENKITSIIWVPTVLNYFLKGFKQSNLVLSRIVWTGEILPTNVFLELQEIFPKALFINSYGPTEITDTCTFYTVNRQIKNNEMLPIGKPFKNTRAYLFDENMNLIIKEEANKKGILYIGGTGVAAGYFKDNEKTKAVFIQNPLNNDYEEIIYNTGDVVAYNEFGELVCYGRADNQIKYKGHRIELGEIENTATSHENVDNSLCIFDELIILIYTGKCIEQDLKEYLKEKLPNYMIPSKIIQTGELKLNQNGKIDRNYYKSNYKELL